MATYKRKSVDVVEAFKWTGGPDQTEDPEWIVEMLRNGSAIIEEHFGTPNLYMLLDTKYGTLRAMPGDYIIKNESGFVHPCPSSEFEKLYEIVE